MKKFALLAMLLCAGVLTLGCGEKKATDTKGTTPAAEQKEGGDQAPATPAEQK